MAETARGIRGRILWLCHRIPLGIHSQVWVHQSLKLFHPTERTHCFYVVISKLVRAAVVECPKAKYPPRVALALGRSISVMVEAIEGTETCSGSAFRDLFPLFHVGRSWDVRK